jgi:LysM repeat protein
MQRSYRPLLALCSLLLAALILSHPSVSYAAPPAQTATPAPPTATDAASGDTGYDYVVKVGDSWSSLAARTGFTIAELQAANPQAVRTTAYLLVGETLRIPGSAAAPDSTPGATTIYVVGAGESWNSIAQKLGIPAATLRAANPQAIRNGLVLYRGEQLVIPNAPVSAATTATVAATPTPPTPAAATDEPAATETPEEEPTAELTAEPTAEPEAEAAEAVTEEPTAAATAAPEAEAAETPEEEPTAEAGPTCPELFSAYPALVEGLLADGDVEAALAFLTDCQALDGEQTLTEDITDDNRADLVLRLVNPRSDAAAPDTELLIFVAGDDGLALTFQARPAGQVRILTTTDLNADDQPDIVWVDTTCGASTCFDTVYVRSWNGESWLDWSDATITMAYGEIELPEIAADGQGREIVLQGGVYGSVGAGPQRSRAEIWGSIDGAPYTLLERTYETSNCLYHKVLDANEALAQADGFDAARELYTEAVTNRLLTKCWQRTDELEELRSFSLFRLAVISAYAGDAAGAAENIDQLVAAYPDADFTALGRAWLEAFNATGDVVAACAAATAFAEANPATYESLSDYGYANPTFTAADLCPVLDVAPAPLAETAAEPEATPTATPEPEATLAPNDLPAVAVPDLPGAAGELPGCPANLSGYATVLPDVLAVTGGDALIVETWLRLCDGMNDERGGLLLQDLDGDGVGDALFLPTLISDLGYGPGGVQGALLIYHGQADGAYELVYSPDILGQPQVVAGDDVNGDGQPDLIYTVASCGTACLAEMRIITWDAAAGEYVRIDAPGAFIAEGEVRIEELPEGAAGVGKQLVLTGGVSGTRAGGIETPHAEVWRTLDGERFRRITWSYDREASGNDCLGLRLVEANVALQAADVLGYAPAAALYRAALDDDLRACSIYGIPASEELRILRGQAAFRLMQTEALSGSVPAAQVVLDELAAADDENPFAAAGAQWLAAFQAEGDPAAACAAVQTIFDRETITWQVTDHFGTDHPPLAPEEMCFVPLEE